MAASVDLRFVVIRPDGLDRETRVGEGESSNAIIKIVGSWEHINSLAIGDFTLAECRLLLGSEDSIYKELKDLCETPQLGSDNNFVVKTITFAKFEAWIKTYKNNNAFTYAYDRG